MTFLVLGMFSMCSVRHELHNTGKKTEKLETLMIRIGMFSGLCYSLFIGCTFDATYYIVEKIKKNCNGKNRNRVDLLEKVSRGFSNFAIDDTGDQRHRFRRP